MSPSGSTAMKDSIKEGIGRLIKINNFLSKLGTEANYKILHIVLTDGDDNCSSTSDEEMIKISMALGHFIKIPVKTIYIGVDIDENEKALKLL
jgi:hypothetical protein